MITINIPEVQYFDGTSSTFYTIHPRTIHLEHSLLSISKWESKHMKPFMGKDSKTEAEIYDYIRCMSSELDLDDLTIKSIPQQEIDRITQYINSPNTATKISEQKNGRRSRDIITSEVIYSWMVSYNIPFECENWHLNRLITLIRICDIQNSPKKKTNMRETMSRNTALNAARKKAMHTSG